MVGSSVLDISFPITSNDCGLDVDGDGRAFGPRSLGKRFVSRQVFAHAFRHCCGEQAR
jgi:hypothetical protein